MQGPDVQGAARVERRGVELGEEEVLEGSGQRACGARRESSWGRVSDKKKGGALETVSHKIRLNGLIWCLPEEFDPNNSFIIPTDISLRQNPFSEFEYGSSIPCRPFREKHNRPLLLSSSFSEGLVHSLGRYVVLCRREAGTGEKRSKSVREVTEKWRLDQSRRTVNSG